MRSTSYVTPQDRRAQQVSKSSFNRSSKSSIRMAHKSNEEACCSPQYTVRATMDQIDLVFAGPQEAVNKAIELTSAGLINVHVVDPTGRHFYASQFERLSLTVT